MKKHNVIRHIKNNEVWLFYFSILLNLTPLFAGSLFPTLDGPAHLYNSRIILELIGNPSPIINHFYQLNELVPNLTGHAIIALFMTVMAPNLAEKSLLVIYAISLPLSFRYLLKSTPSANILFSYFILPFVYSYLFLLGFYNFSISLIFMFLAFGYWLKHSNKHFSVYAFLILSVLCFLTFTSHLVVYGLLIAFLCVQISIELLKLYLIQNRNVRDVFISGMKKILFLVTANVLPLIFAVIYFLKRPQTGANYSYLTWNERISYITDFRPLIAFNYEIELSYTKWLFFLFCALVLFVSLRVISQQIKLRKAKTDRISSLKTLIKFSSLQAAAICIISLLAFLILPDSDGYGGYISVRMALLFLIFLIYWLATTIPQKWPAALAIPVILYVGIGLNIYYSKVIASLNPLVNEITTISKLLKPNCVIMPIDISNNWLLGHYSNYLGLNKPMVVLENYEANSGYFPVKWNESKAQVNFNSEAMKACPSEYPLSNNKDAITIDYLFILGSFTNLDTACQEALINGNMPYEKVYESNNCTLIKLN